MTDTDKTDNSGHVFAAGEIAIVLDKQRRPAGYVRLQERQPFGHWRVVADGPIYNFDARAQDVAKRVYALHDYGDIFNAFEAELRPVYDPIVYHAVTSFNQLFVLTDADDHYLGTVHCSSFSGSWSAATASGTHVCGGIATREAATASLQRYLLANAKNV